MPKQWKSYLRDCLGHSRNRNGGSAYRDSDNANSWDSGGDSDGRRRGRGDGDGRRGGWSNGHGHGVTIRFSFFLLQARSIK